jgi:hypothetical protein
MSAMGRRPPMPRVLYSVTRLGSMSAGGATFPGGVDLVTPSLALHPGALRDGLNFECLINGGYGRIEGYERFDGRAAPSAASFVIVQVAAFTSVPAVGNTIAQAVSGATGTVAAVSNLPGLFYLIVTRFAGSFDGSHALTNTTTSQAVGSATPSSVILSSQQTAQYTAAAAEIYRALIQPVPGSGPVLGVAAMTFAGVDNVYAFRANAGGTAVNIWKASGAGWVQIPLLNLVTFSGGGTATPLDGQTLIQGGVTATIRRVMTRSGAWTGTASGGFVVTNPVGGSFAAGAATTSGGATVTLGGAQAAITLLPGGHFQWAKANFGGQSTTRRLYGCDGVNKAFEFDGTTLAPITTGLPNDAPSNIVAHKGYLFISYGSSVMYSGAGTPFRWSAVDGGGEIAVGDVVTGMITLPGSQTTATLAVYQAANTSMLYGNDPSSWNLVNFNTSSGARPYSLQNLFDSFSFDNLGPVNLQTTLSFGNFASGALAQNILPFILRQRTKVAASTVNRGKGQYRVFFNDGYGLYLTVSNQQYLGAIPQLFPNAVYCCDEAVTSNGAEVAYFGSSDGQGYVYQLDSGPSFDGRNLDAYIVLAWDALKAPRLRKRFRAASLEVASGTYVALSFGYQLGYGTPAISQPVAVTYPTNFMSAPVWDQFVWDQFVWDGQTLTPTDVDMVGTAENVQVTLASSTNYIGAYALNSLIYHYTPRRGLRV